ncbi:MAG: hypothetical protein ACRC3Y_16520 [Romboutsia sp.]|uniref:hypothetical protein n=1 Tax=Romboutsia sp. TaxID=1965302 RepID=UPI003F342E8D
MTFEDLLIDIYPINNKNNRLKKFIQHNLHGKTLILYIQELAIYMVAATKVSGSTILEKILYEQNIDNLNDEFKKEKEEIIKDDIYFELKEDEDENGYFFIKANEEVIAIIEEDLQLFKELQDFILD